MAEVTSHGPPSLVLSSTWQPRTKTLPYSLAVWSAMKLSSGQWPLSLRPLELWAGAVIWHLGTGLDIHISAGKVEAMCS